MTGRETICAPGMPVGLGWIANTWRRDRCIREGYDVETQLRSTVKALEIPTRHGHTPAITQTSYRDPEMRHAKFGAVP